MNAQPPQPSPAREGWPADSDLARETPRSPAGV